MQLYLLLFLLLIPYLVNSEEPHIILGVAKDATEDQIREAFHKLILKHHPDKGGDIELHHRIVNAYEELLQTRRQKPASPKPTPKPKPKPKSKPTTIPFGQQILKDFKYQETLVLSLTDIQNVFILTISSPNGDNLQVCIESECIVPIKWLGISEVQIWFTPTETYVVTSDISLNEDPIKAVYGKSWDKTQTLKGPRQNSYMIFIHNDNWVANADAKTHLQKVPAERYKKLQDRLHKISVLHAALTGPHEKLAENLRTYRSSVAKQIALWKTLDGANLTRIEKMFVGQAVTDRQAMLYGEEKKFRELIQEMEQKQEYLRKKSELQEMLGEYLKIRSCVANLKDCKHQRYKDEL